jgi:IS1 family transposase
MASLIRGSNAIVVSMLMGRVIPSSATTVIRGAYLRSNSNSWIWSFREVASAIVHVCSRLGRRRAWSHEKTVAQLQQVNHRVLNDLHAEDVPVLIQKVEAAEVDEMWSMVGKKTQPRWVWQALAHRTGVMWAYAFGSRQDAVLVPLPQLLTPLGLHHVYRDGEQSISDTESLHSIPLATHTRRRLNGSI